MIDFENTSLREADEEKENESSARAAVLLKAGFLKPLPQALANDKAGAFTIDPANLTALIKVLGVLGNDVKEAVLSVHVLIDRLRVTTFHKDIKFSVEARLARAAPLSAGIHFAMNANQLMVITKNSRRILNCSFDASEQNLQICSGQSELNIETLPMPEFAELEPMPKYPAAIHAAADGRENAIVNQAAKENPDQVSAHRRIDSRCLVRMLAFIRRAAKEDKKQPSFGVVEVENGVGRGGTPMAVAAVKATALEEFNIKFRASDVRAAGSLLNCMHRPYFSETDEAYDFRDEHMAASILKPPFSFPAVKQLLEESPIKKLSVRAEAFTKALSSFAPLTVGHRGEVVIEFRHDTDRPGELLLSAIVPGRPLDKGHATVPTISVDKQLLDQPAKWSVRVNARSLMRLVSYNGDISQWIEISALERGNLLFVEDHDGFKTHAVLAQFAA